MSSVKGKVPREGPHGVSLENPACVWRSYYYISALDRPSNLLSGSLVSSDLSVCLLPSHFLLYLWIMKVSGQCFPDSKIGNNPTA